MLEDPNRDCQLNVCGCEGRSRGGRFWLRQSFQQGPVTGLPCLRLTAGASDLGLAGPVGPLGVGWRPTSSWDVPLCCGRGRSAPAQVPKGPPASTRVPLAALPVAQAQGQDSLHPEGHSAETQGQGRALRRRSVNRDAGPVERSRQIRRDRHGTRPGAKEQGLQTARRGPRATWCQGPKGAKRSFSERSTVPLTPAVR